MFGPFPDDSAVLEWWLFQGRIARGIKILQASDVLGCCWVLHGVSLLTRSTNLGSPQASPLVATKPVAGLVGQVEGCFAETAVSAQPRTQGC